MNEAFDEAAPAAPGSGLFGLATRRKDARVHVLPVPFEATTSYGKGTAKGPRAVLRASHQVDLFDIDTGRPYEAGIVMLPESAAIKKLDESCARAGAKRINAAGEKVNELVRRAAKRALDDGRLMGVLGGDHSTPYGLIAELAGRHPGMGILHIDAHHDLREAFDGYTWSHASIMHNVTTRLPAVERLVQVGIRDFCGAEAKKVAESGRRIIAHYDQEIAGARFDGVPFTDVARAILDPLPQDVYVSFDVDGLDPRLCPNTGTPVPGGLDFNEAVHLLRVLADSGRRIVGFDLVEVAPGRDEWDANVGARLLYKLIGFALMTQ